MNRRGFLSSLPFLPSAAKAVAVAIATATVPRQLSPMEEINALFARQSELMQRQIMEHVARTNPYAELFRE